MIEEKREASEICEGSLSAELLAAIARAAESDGDEKRIVCALYPDHRPWDLEPHYCNHVGGMTEFRLHRKHDIALQLAWRDKRIAELEEERPWVWDEPEFDSDDGAENPYLREITRAKLDAVREALLQLTGMLPFLTLEEAIGQLQRYFEAKHVGGMPADPKPAAVPLCPGCSKPFASPDHDARCSSCAESGWPEEPAK